MTSRARRSSMPIVRGVAMSEVCPRSTPERDALKRIEALGLHDSFRLHNDAPGHYSWWDYRLQAFDRGWGLRIDLLLVSEALRAACSAGGIDLAPRQLERPSDHAPAWLTLG